MKRFSTVLTAFAIALLLAAPARADWLLEGGKILPRGDDAIRGYVGFPGLGFSFHTLLSSWLEVAPHFDFEYGTELGVEAPVVTVAAGAQLKFRLMEDGAFGLLLLVDPAAKFTFHPVDFAYTMRFGPTLRGSYGVEEGLDVLFRFGLPFEMTFHPDFVFYLPIAFGGGLEIAVNKDVHLYFTSDIGPMVIAAENHSTADVYYRGELGVTYRF